MHAAELIWNSWENGQKIVSLPKKLIPSSRKEAYKIQENLEKFSNDIIAGWKIAATSKEGQKHIGVGGPLAGRILQNKLFKPDDTLNFGHNKMAVAEPEFAFKIGTTLKPKKILYNLEDGLNFALNPKLLLIFSCLHAENNRVMICKMSQVLVIETVPVDVFENCF